MGSKVLYRYIVLLFSLFFCFFTLAYPGEKQQNYFNDTLLVGCEYDYPPFCYENEEGEAAGFSVDLFRSAMKEMGIEVKFKLGLWAELKNDLASKKIDALPLVGITPERQDIFDFTIPYIEMHGAIVVRSGDTDVKSLDDLNGKRIAVMKGDNAEEYLRRTEQGAEIISRPTFEQALVELSNGKYDAVVIQRLLAYQLISENKLKNLEVITTPKRVYKQTFGFAVSEGNNELLSILNEGLSLIHANGTFRRLHSEWLVPITSYMKSRQRIIIGGDFNFPPFEFMDKDGNPTGFNYELMKAIEKELGLQFSFQMGPWDKVLDDLKNGSIDVVQGIFYLPGRDSIFDFSPAHTNISYVIAVRSGMDVPGNLQSLRGKKVLVQKADLIHHYALEQGFEDELVTVSTQEEVLEQLSDGKYDYALVSRLLFYYYLERNRWENLQIGKDVIFSAEYCIGVAEGNTELLDFLTEGLSAIKASGEYRGIYTKWLGVYEEPGFTLKDLLKYAAIILLPLFLFLGASVTWSQTLKKRVKIRTQELQEEIEVRKTAERAALESKRKYLNLFTSIRDAILVTDKDRKIIDCNPAFTDLFGYSLEEIKGKQTLVIYNSEEEYSRIGDELKAQKENTNVLSYTIHYKRKDATIFPGETNVFYLENEQGDFIGFIGLIRDITVRIKLEKQLQQSNFSLREKNEEIAVQNEEYETLNEELNEKNEELLSINAELEEALEKAKQSDMLKSAFLANISHEIRTPMNGILGFSDLLKKPELVPEKREKYLDAIEKSGERMLSIINNLLDIARIESGQIDLSLGTTSINRILDELFVFFREKADEKLISLTYKAGLSEPGDLIITDSIKLNQILTNLINNAIKYTEKGKVEFGYQANNDILEFYVKDTGVGISEDVQDLIFERFRQGDSEYLKQFEGTGLGLSITKAFVEALGGNIYLKSSPGKGSTFSFTLPFRKPPRK